MTIEMFAVFTVMSLVLSAAMGLLYRSVRRAVMFLAILLGLSWGIGIGTMLTDNDLLWFLFFAPITTALLFLVVKLVDPKFFAVLNSESRGGDDVH